MNDISNNIVVHNPIPTTWAKLVQNSFAKKKEIYVRQLLHQVQGKYYSISFVVHWMGKRTVITVPFLSEHQEESL